MTAPTWGQLWRRFWRMVKLWRWRNPPSCGLCGEPIVQLANEPGVFIRREDLGNVRVCVGCFDSDDTSLEIVDADTGRVTPGVQEAIRRVRVAQGVMRTRTLDAAWKRQSTIVSQSPSVSGLSTAAHIKLLDDQLDQHEAWVKAHTKDPNGRQVS